MLKLFYAIYQAVLDFPSGFFSMTKRWIDNSETNFEPVGNQYPLKLT